MKHTALILIVALAATAASAQQTTFQRSHD
jgi:hypothetical protein